MIQDILDYLVSYIRKQHYSLLNKRFRDLYFRRYGVHISKLEIPKSDLLLKYDIFCDYTKIGEIKQRDIHLNENFITHDRNKEEIEKIKSNLKIFRYPNWMPWMTNMLEEYPNLTEFSVAVKIREDSPGGLSIHTDWIKQKYSAYHTYNLDNSKKMKKLDIILVLSNFNFRNVNYINDIKAISDLGCRICESFEPFYIYPELITDKLPELITDKLAGFMGRVTYPNLTRIDNYRVLDDISIVAPRLETINSDSLIITKKLVEKYPSIRNIGKKFVIDFSSSLDYQQFAEAYEFLYNHDFDLKYIGGVLFEKKYFVSLMELEKKLRFENIKNGKPRFYRSLEAIVDFPFSRSEYWDLFDLTDLTFVSL